MWRAGAGAGAVVRPAGHYGGGPGGGGGGRGSPTGGSGGRGTRGGAEPGRRGDDEGAVRFELVPPPGCLVLAPVIGGAVADEIAGAGRPQGIGPRVIELAAPRRPATAPR